jgi:phage FluMu gp28-like protein
MRTSMRRHSDSIALGVDLGKQHDYSVVTALDLVTGRVLDVWRQRGLEYTEVCRRIVELARTWVAGTIVVDETGLGAPVVDVLAELLGGGWMRHTHRDAEEGGGVNTSYNAIYGFALGNDVKTRLIRRLQIAIERHHLKIPKRFEALIHELKTFREVYSSTGRPTFSNSTGADAHDDCVIALALAVFAMSDETRSQGDSILRTLDRLQGRGHGWVTYRADSFQSNLIDAARLRRRLELGLVGPKEYELLARNELPIVDYVSVWAENGLRPDEYPNV